MHSHLVYNVHVVAKLNAQDDPVVQSIVRLIHETAEELDFQVETDPSRLKPGTLIFAVGGDGTMIEAMHRAVRCEGYALGINLGHVGFLTDISFRNDPGALYGKIKAILQSVYTDDLEQLYNQNPVVDFEDRYVLENSRWPTLAVNDVSISSLESDEMIRYQLLIDDHDAGVHRANSLLVSTATGSTAYALSAGGALLMPDMQSIQIVPVAPATLTSRPLIISGKSTVTVRVHGIGVSVRVDGQKVLSSSTNYTEDLPFELIVKRHRAPAAVVHPKGWNFFDVLTTKLGWRHE